MSITIKNTASREFLGVLCFCLPMDWLFCHIGVK